MSESMKKGVGLHNISAYKANEVKKSVRVKRKKERRKVILS